jgi:hypothetical protein
MTTRIAARLAWPLWLAMTGFLVFPAVHGITHPGSVHGFGGASAIVVFSAFVFAFSSVGALVAAKRPDNPIGWLLLASALCYTLGGAGVSVGRAAGGRFSPPALAQWLGGWVWGAGVGLVVVALLLFPDGRLPSLRWRPALWLIVAGLVGFVLGAGFGSGFLNGTHIPNPFAVSGPLGDVLHGLQGAFLLVAVAAVLALVSIVVRFRRARGVERQQIK